ncbi:MAG: hydrogenase expression/formation protein HypE [Deltaproteobacteria bacterium]|jgi:hydrogenase expression/formation protein HypE|nr:hydrogenase expression/formation protein HypE [Deltaproteobacteria bacterium]
MTTDKILLDHGSGGKISHSLTKDMMLPVFDNDILSALNDGAIFELAGSRLAFSTDSYTVDPIFFPGGNIGDLAINGTVNDIAMCGATPLYLSVGLIIEEGLSMNDLETIINDMGRAAEAAGVTVITGDTKVVPRGTADRIFINTSGIGLIPQDVHVASDNAKAGDKIVLSGTIADHGITILTQREGLSFATSLQSDSAPLNHMIEKMFSATAPGDIHVLRDPTRGGVGTALNEIAEKSEIGIEIIEDKIPLKDEVAGACELLGFDPLYLANEGKLLAFVSPDRAAVVLEAIQSDPYGRDAAVIGQVVDNYPGKVFLKTRIGGNRIVDMLAGEQLPRIC